MGGGGVWRCVCEMLLILELKIPISRFERGASHSLSSEKFTKTYQFLGLPFKRAKRRKSLWRCITQSHSKMSRSIHDTKEIHLHVSWKFSSPLHMTGVPLPTKKLKFWTVCVRAFIFRMNIHCDEFFPFIQFFLSSDLYNVRGLWPSYLKPLILTFAITCEPFDYWGRVSIFLCTIFVMGPFHSYHFFYSDLDCDLYPTYLCHIFNRLR